MIIPPWDSDRIQLIWEFPIRHRATPSHDDIIHL